MQERRAMLPESLRAIANILEDLQRVQKLTESRLSSHGADLQDLKAELQRQIYVQERQAKEIHRLKQELDSLKSAHTSQEARNQKDVPAVLSDPSTVKASADGVAAVSQDIAMVAPPIPEKFYKASASAQNYITASVPLNSETRAHPLTVTSTGYTAPAAETASLATAVASPIASAVSPQAAAASQAPEATSPAPAMALSASEMVAPARAASPATATASPVTIESPTVMSPTAKTATAAPDSSRPILPGTGFSHITIDFLRKLGEK